MERYFVKRDMTFPGIGTSGTYYEGKGDMTFPEKLELSDYYWIKKYGFQTVPACKRSWAYRNRGGEGYTYTASNVKIVRVYVEDGELLEEVV